jgi:hypothetical protein
LHSLFVFSLLFLQVAKPLQQAIDLSSVVSIKAGRNTRMDLCTLSHQGKTTLLKVVSCVDEQKKLASLMDTMDTTTDTEAFIALTTEMDGIANKLNDIVVEVIDETRRICLAWQGKKLFDFMTNEVQSLTSAFKDILSLFTVLAGQKVTNATPPSTSASPSTAASSTHTTGIKKVRLLVWDVGSVFGLVNHVLLLMPRRIQLDLQTAHFPSLHNSRLQIQSGKFPSPFIPVSFFPCVQFAFAFVLVQCMCLQKNSAGENDSSEKKRLKNNGATASASKTPASKTPATKTPATKMRSPTDDQESDEEMEEDASGSDGSADDDYEHGKKRAPAPNKSAPKTKGLKTPQPDKPEKTAEQIAKAMVTAAKRKATREAKKAALLKKKEDEDKDDNNGGQGGDNSGGHGGDNSGGHGGDNSGGHGGDNSGGHGGDNSGGHGGDNSGGHGGDNSGGHGGDNSGGHGGDNSGGHGQGNGGQDGHSQDNGGNDGGNDGGQCHGTDEGQDHGGNDGNNGNGSKGGADQTMRRRWVRSLHGGHLESLPAPYSALPGVRPYMLCVCFPPLFMAHSFHSLCCNVNGMFIHVCCFPLQHARFEPISSSFDSTSATPGSTSATPGNHIGPAGLKQLTTAEIAALQKDCQINATLHTFMRLFVDERGAPIASGVTEKKLLERMRAQGYSNLGTVSIHWFVDKLQTFGIIKKLVFKVCLLANLSRCMIICVTTT